MKKIMEPFKLSTDDIYSSTNNDLHATRYYDEENEKVVDIIPTDKKFRESTNSVTADNAELYSGPWTKWQNWSDFYSYDDSSEVLEKV